jgi:hypothetical protein
MAVALFDHFSHPEDGKTVAVELVYSGLSLACPPSKLVGFM